AMRVATLSAKPVRTTSNASEGMSERRKLDTNVPSEWVRGSDMGCDSCGGCVVPCAPRARRFGLVCGAAHRKYLVPWANAIGYGSRMGPLRWPHSRDQGGCMQAEGAQVAANSKSKNWQDEVYDLLRRHDVTQFAYVPDAGHRILIDRSLADPGVQSVALT